MRVGGRLQQADIPYQQKHPIILFRKAYLALMLVRHLHTLNHHAVPTMTMDILSQRYYMSGARTLVKTVTHDCTTCRKQLARVVSTNGTITHFPSTTFTTLHENRNKLCGATLTKKGPYPKACTSERLHMCFYLPCYLSSPSRVGYGSNDGGFPGCIPPNLSMNRMPSRSHV